MQNKYYQGICSFSVEDLLLDYEKMHCTRYQLRNYKTVNLEGEHNSTMTFLKEVVSINRQLRVNSNLSFYHYYCKLFDCNFNFLVQKYSSLLSFLTLGVQRRICSIVLITFHESWKPLLLWNHFQTFRSWKTRTEQVY